MENKIKPFATSQVKDIVYHGTNQGNIDKFRNDIGGSSFIWFTPDKWYAGNHVTKHSNKGTIYSAYIDLKNPLFVGNLDGEVFDDFQVDDDYVPYEYEGREVNPIVIELAQNLNISVEDLLELCALSSNRDWFVYDITNDYDFPELIKSKGFDGVIGFEDFEMAMTYGVMSNDQIKVIEKEEFNESYYVKKGDKYLRHNGDNFIKDKKNAWEFVDLDRAKEHSKEGGCGFDGHVVKESVDDYTPQDLSKVDIIQTAGYILEDGKIIILNEYHGEEEDLRGKGLPEFSSTHLEEDTCIRLYANHKPNSAQWDTIDKIISIYLDYPGYCKIEVWEKHPVFYATYNYDTGEYYEDVSKTYKDDCNYGSYDLVRILKNFYNRNESYEDGKGWSIFGEYGGDFSNLSDAKKAAKEISLYDDMKDEVISIHRNADGIFYIDYKNGKCIRNGWRKRTTESLDDDIEERNDKHGWIRPNGELISTNGEPHYTNKYESNYDSSKDVRYNFDECYIALPDEEITSEQLSTLETLLRKYFVHGMEIQYGMDNMGDYKFFDVYPQDSITKVLGKINRVYRGKASRGGSYENGHYVSYDESLDESVRDIMPDQAEKYFGTTEDPQESGYILPNGKFLDFSDGAPGRNINHQEIAFVDDEYNDNYDGGDYKDYWESPNYFIEKGAIRIGGNTYLGHDNTGAFIITSKIRPTQAQVNSLKKFINTLTTDYLWVAFGKTEEGEKCWDKPFNAEEIINYIVDNTGIKESIEWSGGCIATNESLKDIEVYRVGQVKDTGDWGIYFTDSLDYFDQQSVLGYDREDAKPYKLDLNCKVWDPVKELNLNPYTWTTIWGRVEDFDRLGIYWECSEDIPEEELDSVEWGYCSTDDLAVAGKKLGYDITILRDIPADGGWGDYFTEYAVYNPKCVKPIEEVNESYRESQNKVVAKARDIIEKWRTGGYTDDTAVLELNSIIDYINDERTKGSLKNREANRLKGVVNSYINTIYR